METIPRVDEAAVRAESESKPRVLLALQDKGLRRRASAFLRREGYEVTSARDGAQAVDGFIGPLGVPPRVVVADARLPGWSGLDMLSLIARASLHVGLVLLVSRSDDEALFRGRRLRAAAILDQDVDVERLRMAVGDALDPSPAKARAS